MNNILSCKVNGCFGDLEIDKVFLIQRMTFGPNELIVLQENGEYFLAKYSSSNELELMVSSEKISADNCHIVGRCLQINYRLP